MSGIIAVRGRSAARSVAAQARSAQAQPPVSVAIYLHDLAGGGVERQTLIIAEELGRTGINVTLVLHKVRGPLIEHLPPGLRVVDLDSPRTLHDIPRLARFLRRERPDVLIANVDLNNVAALLAKALAFSRTKVVICQHNALADAFIAHENWTYRFVAPSYRLLSPLISRAVAVSSGVAEELRSASGLPPDRLVVINNPVVGDDFESRCNAAAEHAWFGHSGRPVLITAGRLVPQKDHETLLRAMAIHRQRHDSRLLILGSGPRLSQLQSLARELGLGEAVDFLGFRPDPLPYMRQADAFVLTSTCEGFGNVLVEAMGCGTPVISTRCDYGPREILADGRYGLLVELGSPEALAAAMDQIATLRERFPAEMLRRRAAEFSYAVCVARYLGMLKSLAPHRAWAA